MTKAISTTITAAPATTPGLPAPSRRRLLAGSGFAAGLAAIGLAATATSAHAEVLCIPAMSPDHPDADLIHLCAQHTINWHAYNEHGGTKPYDEPDPLWDAYEQTRNAISAAKPMTMEGMRAMAQVSLVEADGSLDGFTGTPAQFWVLEMVAALATGAVA